MPYPIELAKFADQIYEKTKKVSCYDEQNNWQCPVYAYESECDVDCRKNIYDVCKEAWLNGVIKFKEGKLWHRKDFLRMRKGS